MQGRQPTPASDADERRAAKAELDSVIDEIRHVEGFEQFLAAPDFNNIAAAADNRPIVYLAADLSPDAGSSG